MSKMQTSEEKYADLAAENLGASDEQNDFAQEMHAFLKAMKEYEDARRANPLLPPVEELADELIENYAAKQKLH